MAGGGPAVRRSSSHRWRDQRRRWTFHLQLFVFGFLCFSAFFTVYELSRDGYLGVEYLSQQPQVILHHYESANRHSNFLHSATFQHTLAERDHWSVRVETSSSSGGWVNNNRSGLENSDQQLLSINSRNEQEETVESAGEVSKITSSMYSEASDTGNREELWNPPQGYNWLGQGFLGKFTNWLSSSEDSEKPNSKLGEAGSVTGSLVHSSMNTGYINKLDGNDGRIPGNGTKVNDKSAEGDKSLMSSKEKTDEEEAHDTHASWPESNKTLTSDQCNADGLILQSASEFEIPRVIPKCWKPPQPCGTAEEMGLSVVGDTRAASLRVRQMIKLYMLEHGAQRVVLLPGEEFCKRSFVLGHAFEDGFGNNVYKVLTAAGLSLLLNRSLIIGERGATNPTYVGGSKKPFIAFGDYVMFSNETFSMQKVKHLWALHDCAGKYKRPLTMQVDDLEPGFARSRCLCDDWTISPNAILWFKGTSDTVGLQCLLKNANGAMRSVAAKLLGNPSVPNSRPNTFGELLWAFMSPSPDIHHAVEWALKGGPDPDIALHLRMRHNHNQAAIAAASACILHTTHTLTNSQEQLVQVLTSCSSGLVSSVLLFGITTAVKWFGRRKLRLVVVSDTPEVFHEIKGNVGELIETFQFDYMAYLNEFKNLSEVMSLHYGQPPRNRMKDWGEMPRWVSLVDFFLAARARVAVISGAYERVSTTYAQLVASLAAASTMMDGESSQPSKSSLFYSSFQPDLVAQGLMKQSGWGHSWRTFGGKLGCRNQTAQCARTPLLPYAWWDSPWQSPSSRDIRKLQMIGIEIDEVGQVSEHSLDDFCAAQEKPIVLQMRVPTCTKLKPCTSLIS